MPVLWYVPRGTERWGQAAFAGTNRMIETYGSSRSVLVAYMLPAFALLYGAVFLAEALTWQKLFGMVMILGGVGLGSGAVRLPRRLPVTQSP